MNIFNEGLVKKFSMDNSKYVPLVFDDFRKKVIDIFFFNRDHYGNICLLHPFDQTDFYKFLRECDMEDHSILTKILSFSELEFLGLFQDVLDRIDFGTEPSKYDNGIRIIKMESNTGSLSHNGELVSALEDLIEYMNKFYHLNFTIEKVRISGQPIKQVIKLGIDKEIKIPVVSTLDKFDAKHRELLEYLRNVTRRPKTKSDRIKIIYEWVKLIDNLLSEISVSKIKISDKKRIVNILTDGAYSDGTFFDFLDLIISKVHHNSYQIKECSDSEYEFIVILLNTFYCLILERQNKFKLTYETTNRNDPCSDRKKRQTKHKTTS